MTVAKRSHEILTIGFPGCVDLTAHELRLTTHELRLTADELRLTGHELRLTGHELRLTGHELRLTADELRLTADELRLTKMMAIDVKRDPQPTFGAAHELFREPTLLSADLTACAHVTPLWGPA